MIKLTTAAALVAGLGTAAPAYADEKSTTVPTCDFQDQVTVVYAELGEQLKRGSVLSMTADFLRARVEQDIGTGNDQSFLNAPEGNIVTYKTGDGQVYGFSRYSAYDEQMGKNIDGACAVELSN